MSVAAAGPLADPAPPAPGRSRRAWIILTVCALIVSAVCVQLGRWQWHRHLDRQERIAVVMANYSADPVALDTLVEADGSLVPGAEWHPATVHGTYLTDSSVMLRARPAAGVNGTHLLSAFLTEIHGHSAVLLVDRGFLPADDGWTLATAPVPATGPVDLVVRVRPAESPDSRGVADGFVWAISPTQVLSATYADAPVIAGVYGAAVSENPAGQAGLQVLPEPDATLRNNLSYAFQWWFFAAGAPAAVALLYWRDHRRDVVTLDDLIAADDPDGQPQPRGGSSRRSAKQPGVDETAEDAAIDAQAVSGAPR